MIYHFNNFLLDTVKFTLTRVDESIPVEPQVFNVILYLIEQKDRVVSRQELLDAIWKDKVVADSSISNHIKSARKVLDDDGIKQV
ncbi:Adenylate cyclase, partial [hydrothermal vent metagenome]